MPVEQSILKSTKKILGLDDAYDAFDLDVITHINSSFFTLNQLGIGPTGGFSIEDETAEWVDYTDGELNLNAVKTYIFLKVRSYFDPPGTPHHMAAMKEQITELEYRLKMEHDLNQWDSAHNVQSLTELGNEGLILDGGE